MAKIYGLFGAMQGKLADSVMVVRNGVQMVRKYQPMVANPSTEGQVVARAKMKLMSQLSAVMAPVVAMPREGMVSPRNLFVKQNYGAATYEDSEASINLAGLQLTKSVVSFPAVFATRVTDGITAAVGGTIGLDVDHVVYCMFIKQPDNTLRYVKSEVSSTSGPNNDYIVTFPAFAGEVIVLAYGVRNNTDAARATFGNMEVLSGEDVAKVVTSRTLTEADITLTETKGVQLAAQQ